MRKNIFIFIITVVLILFFSSFATADNCGGTIQCHCGDTLVESQVMWYDLINCPNHGLEILTSDITLDCDGHLIDGDGSGISDMGIILRVSGISVTNCNIQEFDFGIYTDTGSSNNILIYNAVSDNIHYGIKLHKSFNNIVYGNNLFNNRVYGIKLDYSSDNYIYDNEFADNAWANAFEDDGSYNNNWNLSNIGNYWDDFPSNPGYPDYYEIPGEGSGIDWHPIWEDVWITLMPTGSTTFPASGGILEYNIEGGNNEPTNVILDIWVDVSVPGWTHSYGPVVGPVLNFNMLAYPWQTAVSRELTIPTRAPAGTYTVNAYLGEYDTLNPIIYVESYFDFIKEGTEGRSGKFKLVDSGEVFK